MKSLCFFNRRYVLVLKCWILHFFSVSALQNYCGGKWARCLLWRVKQGHIKHLWLSICNKTRTKVWFNKKRLFGSSSVCYETLQKHFCSYWKWKWFCALIDRSNPYLQWLTARVLHRSSAHLFYFVHVKMTSNASRTTTSGCNEKAVLDSLYCHVGVPRDSQDKTAKVTLMRVWKTMSLASLVWNALTLNLLVELDTSAARVPRDTEGMELPVMVRNNACKLRP